MAITDHYMEVLRVLHTMFKHIFQGLETRHASLLQTVRSQYHSEPVQFTAEPCVVHWEDAICMLREAGNEVSRRQLLVRLHGRQDRVHCA